MKKIVILLTATLSIVFASNSKVAPVDNALYQKECGSCHFAYQAEFLPKSSWVKMMDNLKDHFGSDASLNDKEKEEIKKYLVANSKTGVATLRISELPYFIKEHRKISQKIITQKEVGRISNCTACHTTAEKGIYSERAINIPNYGRWDD